ncbi:hypothetical protein CDAR_276401 [Caerostris darwini]|uniref:Uncharacterized protein n=1 Tax=Caerostris darwini TaxID=1538125 RepID=A0AAV4QAY7_9ARAC|nr:hypothetical protein CDAR_276401 [Caerostris darwini]
MCLKARSALYKWHNLYGQLRMFFPCEVSADDQLVSRYRLRVQPLHCDTPIILSVWRGVFLGGPVVIPTSGTTRMSTYVCSYHCEVSVDNHLVSRYPLRVQPLYGETCRLIIFSDA